MNREEELLKFRSIPDFKYVDIVRSDEFYKRIVAAAKLSDANHESSFAVYGNSRGLKMTKPLQEYEDSCQTGYDPETAMTHTVPGAGMDIPKNCFPLVKVHYHTIDNVAIPSEDDLNSCTSQSNTPIILNSEIRLILGLEIVGLRVGRSQLLFCYQYNGSLGLTDMEAFNQNLTHKIDDAIRINGRMDRSATAVYNIAKIMRESGAYRTHVIYSPDKAKFMAEARGLGSFVLSVPVINAQQ